MHEPENSFLITPPWAVGRVGPVPFLVAPGTSWSGAGAGVCGVILRAVGAALRAGGAPLGQVAVPLAAGAAAGVGHHGPHLVGQEGHLKGGGRDRLVEGQRENLGPPAPVNVMTPNGASPSRRVSLGWSASSGPG